MYSISCEPSRRSYPSIAMLSRADYEPISTDRMIMSHYQGSGVSWYEKSGKVEFSEFILGWARSRDQRQAENRK
jgi:hypothetical protein